MHFCSIGRAKASVTSLPSKMPQVCQVFEERPDIQRCTGVCIGAGTDVTGRGFGLALLSFEKPHLQFCPFSSNFAHAHDRGGMLAVTKLALRLRWLGGDHKGLKSVCLGTSAWWPAGERAELSSLRNVTQLGARWVFYAFPWSIRHWSLSETGRWAE